MSESTIATPGTGGHFRPVEVEPENAAGRLAALLREELLSARYPPGERLKEEELAARFRTGRYTVRAALRILVSSGLLDHRPNRGASVPLLTRDRVNEVSAYREVLEVGALRLALQRQADLDAFVAATRALERLPDDAPWIDVVETHQAIHTSLLVAAGNDRLLAAYLLCEEELRYIVSTVRPDFTAGRLAALHTRLLAGIHCGGDAAVTALEADLHTGRQAVLDALPHPEHAPDEAGPGVR
ncbi:GntR family transcriptional regulator [Modestobacter lapidis]|nr:GntR family transcriptional regulator [Modestobacter lapidis]